MDEELGVKVTRLRRRLSIESEGTQSPATPSTPTKKRAARLAKPALDLIDENVLENVPKRGTRKSIARDVAEPTDEKPVTPSRRSARIRSNTSLIMESTQPVLNSPRARRATRRNSQLSSDNETATTPAKPTRRTRKDSSSSVEKLALTNPIEKSIAQVTKAITEEPEKEVTKDANKSDDQSPTLKKSPRLNKRGRKSMEEAVKITHEEKAHEDKTLTDSAKIELSSRLDNRTAQEASTNTNTDSANKIESEISEKENLSLSSTNLISEIDPNPKKSAVLNKTVSAIEGSKIEKYSKKRTKSWTNSQTSERSNLYNKNTIKSSDDSCLKNSTKMDVMSPNKSIKAALTFNSSTENKENMTSLKSMNALDAMDTVKVLGKTPTKDMQSIVFMEDSDSNSDSIGKLTMDIPKDLHSQHDADDQCVPVVHQTSKKSSPSESFSVEPMDIDETIPENVTINDFSDKTNSSREEDNFRDSGQNDSKRKSSLSNENSIVVNESLNKSKKASISLQDLNNSKRKSSISSFVQNNNHSNAGVITPDNANNFKRKSLISSIDFEIGNRDSVTSKGDDNESTNTFKRQSLLSNTDTKNTKRKLSVNSEVKDNENKANEIAEESKTKSSILNVESETSKLISVSSQAEDNDKIINTANISKGKPVCEAESQKLESTNENRSTLVLSQFRDTSTNDVSNASKSHNDTDHGISKFVTMSDLNKKTDKKNLSQNYLTSTPLQQKSLQKLTMQINTSNISLNNENKNVQNPKIMESPNKNVSNVVNNFDTSDDDSDESSKKESNMLDDEAIDAGVDYESGDSRNEEDREYEKIHEFVEKGETLDSEEEISNDSDYEKDSFVVTSNEEDDDLLSGSGDDLSFSDNELKMNAKSKKKFDERKRKEQKKASKEMFEARHKLNKSDKSFNSKTNKFKRQRLESSTLDSDKEEEAQPKKKNRLRIDSSLDVTSENSNADESVRSKKKKIKRLSESFCEGGNEDPNEKEITIHNQSAPNKNDPLSVAIKLEPKTPQKDFNISTVQISDAIENVQIDNAIASVMKPTRTTDPLQLTLAQEDETSESDISENLEIRANYDNVLENLNRSNKQKKNTFDISLNLDKKAKNKVTKEVVDQLNLTETTKSKKNKEQVVQKNEITTEPPKTKKTISISPEYDGGDISDSIDMRLLFPEDSNDSESYDSKFKPNKKEDVETTEQLIPLKRTEASTNIRESLDLDLPQNESELNVSITKNKNRKPSDNIPDSTNEPEEKSCSFFIDTKGTYGDMETSSTLNSSKKNKKDMSVNEHNETLTGIADNTNTEYMLHDVSVVSEKKKKKHKKNDTDDLTLDESQSGKSSKGAAENVDSDNLVADETNTEHTPLEVSYKSDKKKKKHENKNISKNIEQDITIDVSHSGKKTLNKASESEAENIQDRNDESVSQLFLHESFKGDKKKKKNKNTDTSVNKEDNLEETNTSKSAASNEMENLYPDSICITEPQESSFKSEKKKKKNKNVDTTINIKDMSTVSVSQSGKKKSKKVSESALDIETDNAVAETTTTELSSLNVSNKSEKKKKKNKNGDTSVINEGTSDATDTRSGIQNKSQETTIIELSALNVSNKSDKKKKKNADTSIHHIETSEATDTHSGIQNKSQGSEIVVNVTPTSDKKKKKKRNKSTDISQTETTITELSLNVSNKSDKKKKKNKNSDTSVYNEQISEAGVAEEIKTQNEVTGSVITKHATPNSDKKKKKKNKSFDISQTEPVATHEISTGSGKKKKNKKNKNIAQQELGEEVVEPQKGVTKSKKRKHDTSLTPPADNNDEIHLSSRKQKKPKIPRNDEDDDAPVEERISYIGEVRPCDIETVPEKKFKKKKKKPINKNKVHVQGSEQADTKNKSKKRKAPEDHDGHQRSKVLKQNSFDEVHVSRLPESIINQLGDKSPKESKKQKKPKAISTVPFEVEEALKRKNKPSNYLEQSIYLNDKSPAKQKQKASIKNPKVLPFTPTAITSGKGYTSNFKINMLPESIEFVAQASDVTNFKTDYLSNQRRKKLGTFERCKIHRNLKLAKF